MPDDAQVAPRQTLAALRRQLAARTAERDEALAQQAAISEILHIINASPGDLAPVFDAILEKATRVCEAAFGVLLTWDGERLHRVAFRGVPPELIEALQQPMPPVPGTIADRLVRGEWVISTPDLREAEYQGGPGAQAFLRHGARSCVHVALHKEKRLLGSITVYREEVRPFSDKQIALLENFAAQAVIAMENARLLTETREALEQQTATAEVLQVINSSPGDLGSVFDAMLEKAMRLCEAAFGTLWTYDGEFVQFAAARGHPRFDEWTREVGPSRVHPGSTVERLLQGEPVVHIPDAREDEAYRSGNPRRRLLVDVGGARSYLTVPLRKGDNLLGAFAIYRQEVRPFTDKQIALLQNFAAQAVMAMENARLLTETREALEQQTATAEVLQVINSSPGDLAPVFDAMLDKALHLCEAGLGLLHTYDGKRFRALAIGGVSGSAAESLREWVPDPDSALQRIVDGKLVVHIPDVVDTEAYRSGVASRRKLVELTGARTALWVALRKDDTLLGVFVIYRREVRPFTDKQIALVENFAAQAVIAMENARLLTETREALEQQTATAEVLQVINSSPGDLAPVFDAMLEKAVRLCDAAFGLLWRYGADGSGSVAHRGVPPAFARFLAENPLTTGPGTGRARVLQGERFVHLADVADDEPYRAGDPMRRAIVDLGGARTGLNMPMRKDGTVVGLINVFRQEVRPFSDKQIALLENFAAQAVIAMENARLLTETREALEQQTATAEVLQVINSSPGDLAPVFEVILEKAHRLCGVHRGSLQLVDGDRFRAVATRFPPDAEAFAERLRRGYPASDTPVLQPLRGGVRFVHVPDLAEIDDPVARAAVAAGTRSILYVPLRRDDAFLGMIVAAREEVRPFSEKEIALLENFAAQAVIAMENARLLTETREALEQQTATAEVLQVINSSPGDLTPVFDAMLAKALRLCDASFGVLSRIDGNNFSGIAVYGAPPELADALRQPRQIMPGNAHHRLVHGEDIVQIEDVTADDVYRSGNPARRALADVGGARTVLWVALRKEDAALGAFVVYRTEVRPFTDKQIALLQNFAAQAVIAMENARLLTETREALEQQTATAEVLQVINSSPGDLAPVFDTMLEKAMRLCEAGFGMMHTCDGKNVHPVAMRGIPPRFAEFAADPASQPGPGGATPRLAAGARFVHVADLMEEEAYQLGEAYRRALVDLGGARTLLAVPLRKDGVMLGQIVIYRTEAPLF